MTDDMLTHDNVIAVTFPEEANAYEALARLKELDAQGDVDVPGAAVVAREEDGKITIKDQFGKESYEDTAGGGLIGLLVGVLGGPLGVLVGGATGLVIGSLTMTGQIDWKQFMDPKRTGLAWAAFAVFLIFAVLRLGLTFGVYPPAFVDFMTMVDRRDELGELLRTNNEEMIKRIRGAVDSEADWQQQIRQAVGAYVDHIASRPAIQSSRVSLRKTTISSRRPMNSGLNSRSITCLSRSFIFS